MRILKIYLVIGLVLLMTTNTLSVIGCGKTGINGTYVNEDNPDEYLELNDDGTFNLNEYGIGWTGEWEIDGDTITLSFPTGFAARGELKGNKIFDEDGKVWVKEVKSCREL